MSNTPTLSHSSARRAAVTLRLAPGMPATLDQLAHYAGLLAEITGRARPLPSQLFELAVREGARQLTGGQIA